MNSKLSLPHKLKINFKIAEKEQ